MASLLRKKRSVRRTKTVKRTLPANVTIKHALMRRKEHLENENVPFLEQGQLIRKYCKEFKDLPLEEQVHFQSLWSARQKEHAENVQSQERLKAYNRILSPCYKKKR